MPRVIATAVLSLIAGCGPPAPPAAPPTAAPRPAAIPAPRPAPAYEVTQDVNIRHEGRYRFVAVQLGSKVPEGTLAAYAREIRSAKPNFSETTIDFFAPKRVPDAIDNPWATAKVVGEPVIEVYALTLEREARFRALPRPSGPDVVGTWLVENPRWAQLVTVHRSKDWAWLEERFEPEGPSREAELAEVPSPAGRKFAQVGMPLIYDVAPDGILRTRSGIELSSSTRAIGWGEPGPVR